jgi:hypothetical protein
MWNGMDNFLVVRALGVPGEMTYIGQGQKVYVFACHSLQDGWSYKGSCLFAGGNVAFPITEGITEL